MIIDKTELIHSVDRKKLAETINKEARKINKIQNILIQLNLTREATKSGIKENELFDFLETLKKYENIKVIGLMTMPYFTDNTEEIRPFFSKLRNLRDEAVKKGYTDIKELSMGMSNDYKTAIEEGATMIRIGTAIFGKREY
jgi:pyridoxal phosphate enzyme (YggS family)